MCLIQLRLLGGWKGLARKCWNFKDSIGNSQAFPGFLPVLCCLLIHASFYSEFSLGFWVWSFKFATKTQNFCHSSCHVLLLGAEPMFGKCTSVDVFDRAIWISCLVKVICSYKSFWNKWRYKKLFIIQSLNTAPVCVHDMQRSANCPSAWLSSTSLQFKHW